MYIKNQTFKDEDTLEEMIFDFSIGDSTPFIEELIKEIQQELEQNEAYQQYRMSLHGEDREELEAEEQDLRLAEKLQQHFDSYKVHAQKFYGIKNGVETLLYSIDMI